MGSVRQARGGVSEANNLPDSVEAWFAGRGWQVRDHQRQLVREHAAGKDTLLIAPTGAGKTLAGFLPSLIALGAAGASTTGGIHTLYVSPLKALAVDIERNLATPVSEMRLPIRIETRTGDTPAARRERQRRNPPDILLTTPEQVSLMIASADAAQYFGSLQRVIIDELHALAPGKRGDLLALAIARLRRLSPRVTVTGLSATVSDPPTLRGWLTPQVHGEERLSALVTVHADAARPPRLQILETEQRLPWSGHSARHAMAEIYAQVQAHKLTLIFVNTRMQAEYVFQMLWAENEANLRIALHHGSLDVSQRRRVEAAMASGGLDAIVCTATLDLGIDWGDVDLVINIGAPKGASRLLQRVGRANHRMDEPSKAILVPSNRFEVLECRAAVDAALMGEQDAETRRQGALDVLAQHIMGMACAAPFEADALYAEVTTALPYATLSRGRFDAVLQYVANGGYALARYDRFTRIRQASDGTWRVSNPRMAQAYRMNVGTIVEASMMKVRYGKPRGTVMVAGRSLGEVEEYFAEGLVPGDTFLFAGELLRFEGIQEDSVLVTRSMRKGDPKIPSYAGGKFPLSTHLASRVRKMLNTPEQWRDLPPQVASWLELQQRRSALPGPDDLLVETFERGDRHHLVAYPFEGRLAHQTLGMLLTRRLERAGLKPQGFVANDYALSVWGLENISARARSEPGFIDALFHQDMLGDDLEAWLAESALMKRTFRYCAVISGLIQQRVIGQEKRGRQITMSTDLIYDVLRSHEPGHVLLQAAREDAATGLLDVRRLAQFLTRIQNRVLHKPLARPSPLSVPVLLEIGRESVYGEAADAVLAEASDTLVRDVMDDMAEDADHMSARSGR
jgi:ATP-dependent helicase Lhr and Lhr-like helicase